MRKTDGPQNVEWIISLVSHYLNEDVLGTEFTWGWYIRINSFSHNILKFLTLKLSNVYSKYIVVSISFCPNLSKGVC